MRGIFFYWAPSKIRERFAMLVRTAIKDLGITEYLLLEHLMVKLPIEPKQIEIYT
jgi:hypothetical protein